MEGGCAKLGTCGAVFSASTGDGETVVTGKDPGFEEVDSIEAPPGETPFGNAEKNSFASRAITETSGNPAIPG